MSDHRTTPFAAGEPKAPSGPSVPAGEPEAPTGPVAPAQEPDRQPAPAGRRSPGGMAAGEPEAPTGPGGAAEAASPEDHERQLERDLEELSAKAEKADEYLELAKRTKADFE